MTDDTEEIPTHEVYIESGGDIDMAAGAASAILISSAEACGWDFQKHNLALHTMVALILRDVARYIEAQHRQQVLQTMIRALTKSMHVNASNILQWAAEKDLAEAERERKKSTSH